MKKDVSARRVACRAVFALGCFVFIQLVGVCDARAESPRKVEGFEALGMLGYGVALGDVTSANKEFEPFGVTVGLDLGYTLPFGLRIGADASRGFGRKVESTSRTGEVVTTDASSITCGGSVGYDHSLSSFRLRGAADAGLLFWYDEAAAPGLYFGPKVALIWQYRAFELGLQSKYWVTSESHSVVQVGLMGGARF